MKKTTETSYTISSIRQNGHDPSSSRHFLLSSSNPRDIHPRPLEDVVTQHFCLLRGRLYGARRQVHDGVSAGPAALGERAWVDAEDGVDDLKKSAGVSETFVAYSQGGEGGTGWQL